MRHRLRRGHRRKVRDRAQRPSAGGQRDRADIGDLVPGEALEDRIVFRIGRQQRRTVTFHGGGQHLARAH